MCALATLYQYYALVEAAPIIPELPSAAILPTAGKLHLDMQ